MEIARRADVHVQLVRLADALDPADTVRSRAIRYELARVIDEHLFDVHHRVNRPPSVAVRNPPPAVAALRAALRSVCLGEVPTAVRDHLVVHQQCCPLTHVTD